MTQMNIAIAGAGGRMGRILIEAVQSADDARLSGALQHLDARLSGLGQRIGGGNARRPGTQHRHARHGQPRILHSPVS